MLMGVCGHRFWIKIVFVVMLVTGSVSVSGAALKVKEVPLELHMDDAQLQAKIELNLLPLLKNINAVAKEIDELNQRGDLLSPSKQVVELLQLCEQWQLALRDSFSCRLGGLQVDWDVAAAQNELPDRAALRQKSRQHLHLHWEIDAQGVRFSDASLREGLQLDLYGLWQGWVLDLVAREIEKIIADQKLKAEDFSLVFGHLTLAVNRSAALDKQVILNGLSPISVPLKNQSVAVLDRKQNLRKVAHYPMSRILVPKEGWPVEFAPSLLVRASKAIDAGVLAQSLMSVSVQNALEQVDKLANVTALAITETGMFFASKNWYSEINPSSTPWPAQQKFSINYEIPALTVAEYRRPYAAIWISDDSGNAIRHLQLLGDNRWLRDLRWWWRKYGRTDDSLVDALAGATAKPGLYHLSWDGRDLHGKHVSKGNYELHMEVVREHGEREAVVLPFVLNGQTTSAATKGAYEIGRVHLDIQ